MNILIIDPWGTNNTREYLSGLANGLSNITSVTLMSNYYYESDCDLKYLYLKTFFKLSEKMKDNKFRKLVRGIEYVKGYIKILYYIQNHNVDLIHINWLLFYKLDIYFLKFIKRMKIPIVYTAHNVVPHIHPEKYISTLRQIYKQADRVIVHGDNVKSEFIHYFPEYENKIYIQLHGYTKKASNKTLAPGTIPRYIREKIKTYHYRFIFCGRIYYDKGTDRIVKYWIKHNPSKVLLIVAGKKCTDYPELTNMEKRAAVSDNILYLNEFITDGLLNYLIQESDLVLLPYRHASMSGVVFTAAMAGKPVFSTSVGSIPEYLMNEKDSFVVPNSDKDIEYKLMEIINNIDDINFKKMGYILHDNIEKMCDWQEITQQLYFKVYMSLKGV